MEAGTGSVERCTHEINRLLKRTECRDTSQTEKYGAGPARSDDAYQSDYLALDIVNHNYLAHSYQD